MKYVSGYRPRMIFLKKKLNFVFWCVWKDMEKSEKETSGSVALAIMMKCMDSHWKNKIFYDLEEFVNCVNDYFVKFDSNLQITKISENLYTVSNLEPKYMVYIERGTGQNSSWTAIYTHHEKLQWEPFPTVLLHAENENRYMVGYLYGSNFHQFKQKCWKALGTIFSWGLS
jgi:hypothetical protein